MSKIDNFEGVVVTPDHFVISFGDCYRSVVDETHLMSGSPAIVGLGP